MTVLKIFSIFLERHFCDFSIFQDFKLDAATIFGRAGAEMMVSRRMTSLRQLLTCVRDSGITSDYSIDDVIAPCIDVIVGDSTMGKEVEELIKMMRSDVNKINAYIASGRLKSAYMIAVKTRRTQVVKVIARKAEEVGQKSVKALCDRWLQQQDT